MLDISVLASSRTYALAQKYSEIGYIVFDSIRDFIFQHPLMVHFIRTLSGLDLLGVTYIEVLLRILLIGINATLINFLIKKYIKKDHRNYSFILANIASISIISFSYSERIEFSLITMFTLMYITLTDWYYDLKKSIIMLILVVGITFGSSTASIILIPIFFFFSFFKKNFTTTIYGFIPLVYMIYVGGPYTSALGYYSFFAWEGLLDFISALMLGSLPERVIPWNRVTLTTLGDTYITTLSYLTLMILGAIVLIITARTWFKEGSIFPSDPAKAVYRSMATTLLFVMGIFVLVYIGASIQPETTFSDIRTIVVVFITLLIPYIIVYKDIFIHIEKRSIVYIVLCILFITSSLRTYYETYPKSINDPINVVEDRRVDHDSVIHARYYIQTYFTEADIAYDFKTGLVIPFSLPGERFDSTIFTDKALIDKLLLYDLSGFEIDSLHTTENAYKSVINLQSSSNIIYNNGDIILQDSK